MQIIVEEHEIAYPEAIDTMEKRVDGIIKGQTEELLWLLEHPPLYTKGTSANEGDYIASHHPVYKNFPVYETGRGGEFTYHGTGQRIAYVMLNLAKREAKDIRLYVKNLEQVVINTLAKLGIKGERREGRIGIWVQDARFLGGEAKIAAIGIRVRKWVSFHGLSINLNPDLNYFQGIIPCGISKYGVTSINEINPNITMTVLDKTLVAEFHKIFS